MRCRRRPEGRRGTGSVGGGWRQPLGIGRVTAVVWRPTDRLPRPRPSGALRGGSGTVGGTRPAQRAVRPATACPGALHRAVLDEQCAQRARVDPATQWRRGAAYRLAQRVQFRFRQQAVFQLPAQGPRARTATRRRAVSVPLDHGQTRIAHVVLHSTPLVADGRWQIGTAMCKRCAATTVAADSYLRVPGYDRSGLTLRQILPPSRTISTHALRLLQRAGSALRSRVSHYRAPAGPFDRRVLSPPLESPGGNS